MHKNFSLSRKLAKFAKEKKAAKTLGIVMGVFIVCWLPFFVVNLLSGFCSECITQKEIVFPVVTWLGWINSSMNPVIYACWSRDFRRFVFDENYLDILFYKAPIFLQSLREDTVCLLSQENTKKVPTDDAVENIPGENKTSSKFSIT
jgi:hypothetical protein